MSRKNTQSIANFLVDLMTPSGSHWASIYRWNAFPDGFKESVDKFQIVRSINLTEALEAIKFKWPTTTPSEVLSALEVLEDNNQVRKTKAGIWKILIDRKEIPNTSPYPRFRRSENRNKSGVCPGCGKTVTYKNRHARSGSGHTGEQCFLNKIESIMGE